MGQRFVNRNKVNDFSSLSLNHFQQRHNPSNKAQSFNDWLVALSKGKIRVLVQKSTTKMCDWTQQYACGLTVQCPSRASYQSGCAVNMSQTKGQVLFPFLFFFASERLYEGQPRMCNQFEEEQIYLSSVLLYVFRAVDKTLEPLLHIRTQLLAVQHVVCNSETADSKLASGMEKLKSWSFNFASFTIHRPHRSRYGRFY